MPSSEKRRVVVHAQSPAVEIYVLDHALQRVEGVPDAWGRLDMELAPGIYLLKFKIGPVAAQETLVVEGGSEPLVHEAGAIPIPCVAPVQGPDEPLDEIRARHIQAVDRVCRTVHRTLGEGAQLMIFGRDATGAAWPDGGSELSLRLPGGEELLRANVGERNGAEGWFGANVALDPGGYLLALDTLDGSTMQMPIWVSSGSQTQVFLRRDNFLRSATQNDQLPDLGTATVHIRQIGSGFGNPESRVSEWVTETLFVAYGEGRKGAADEEATTRTLRHLALEMAETLVETAVKAGSAFRGERGDLPAEEDDATPKHGEKARAAIAEALRRLENPMVALLVGRMFARASNGQTAMHDAYLNYLRARLPDHPDARALLVGHDDVPPFEFPPMFAEALATVTKVGLVVPHSLAAEASLEASPHGVWAHWAPPPTVNSMKAMTRSVPMDEDEALETLWTAVRNRPESLLRAAPSFRFAHKKMVQDLTSLAHMAQLEGRTPSMDAVRETVRDGTLPDEVRRSVLSDLAKAVA